ncbi:hypothetical protein Q0590_35995 [Rhodocytophaga aerolata]|uniref:Lipocalin family protein n=1 Tax=Rhodocytophaga aerolata TaxID=455078 RepID=A0ABT8RHZ7_9BACT|nr:hypothetical protein [Rhodocytophaga aerolata]MDO1451732.1 hypothetical protein [Rhodocytophaga aerolata]
MSAKLFTIIILCCCSIQLLAQPHVGVWELEKILVKDSKGKVVEEDIFINRARQVKVLTPTHFMFIAEKIDSLDNTKSYFRRSVAGRYQIQDGKYHEYFDYSTRKEDKLGQKSDDMAIKLEAGKLIQIGDAGKDEKGVRYTWEEVYQKIDLPAQDHTTVGAWEEQTDTYRAMRIITPTHLFEIATSKDGKEIKGVVGATYIKKGDDFIHTFIYGLDKSRNQTSVAKRKMEGDRLITSGRIKDASGKDIGQFTRTFTRVGSKTVKTASTK